jgi:antitoxin ParD1/3/4
MDVVRWMLVMSKIENRTISFSAEQAAFIDAKVASGEYASVSEVVSAGLRALQDHDAAIEKWLREEVAPTYDAVKKDPSRLMSIEQAWDQIRAKHETLVKAKG